MCLADLIKKERDRLNLTQQGLGDILHYSAKTVSAVETGRRQLPDEAKIKLAQLSPRLAIEICSECPANIFPADWLDGEVVDIHPVTVNTKMTEESDEFSSALKMMCLVNKKRPEHLTEQDRAIQKVALMEGMDLLVGIKVWMVNLAQHYGHDLQEVRREHEQKLVSNRYVKRRKVRYTASQKEKALGFVAEPLAAY